MRHEAIAECGNLLLNGNIYGVAITELCLGPGEHSIQVELCALNFFPTDLFISEDECWNVCGAEQSTYFAELFENVVFLTANVKNAELRLQIMIIGER